MKLESFVSWEVYLGRSLNNGIQLVPIFSLGMLAWADKWSLYVYGDSLLVIILALSPILMYVVNSPGIDSSYEPITT